MSVSLLDFLFGIEESLAVSVTSSLNIHHWDFLAVEHTNPELKIIRRPWRNVIVCDIESLHWVDFNPHFESSLSDAGRFMEDLSVLDRFVFEAIPLDREVSVFEINLGSTDEIITEDHIVVHDRDFEGSCAWEYTLK